MTGFERREPDWLTVGRAVRTIVEAARPLPGERVSPEDATDRALAEDLEARATLPPYDNSAMDGYAVRSEDVSGATETEPVRLRVVGEIRAEDAPSNPVTAGEAVRIMTGAPVPAGADTVIRVEDTDAEGREEGFVSIVSDRDVGRHIRPAGQDVRKGDVVLRAGEAVTPGVVALATALGYADLPVRRRPRIALLSSGEELRGPDRFDEVIAGRGIPDTNGPFLAAAVRDAGCRAVSLGIARDDEDDIRERVDAAAGCDALVTTGGASMGEADLFKRALEKAGLDVVFWRVRIRPGSPFSFAYLPARDGETRLPVFGLPGNPASAFVTFQLFVRPHLLALAGHRRIHRPVVRAVAGEAFPSTSRLTHFHRVVLETEAEARVARLTGPQSSGLVQSLGLADGLAVVPEGVERLDEGAEVEVIVLDSGPGQLTRPGYRP